MLHSKSIHNVTVPRLFLASSLKVKYYYCCDGIIVLTEDRNGNAYNIRDTDHRDHPSCQITTFFTRKLQYFISFPNISGPNFGHASRRTNNTISIFLWLFCISIIFIHLLGINTWIRSNLGWVPMMHAVLASAVRRWTLLIVPEGVAARAFQGTRVFYRLVPWVGPRADLRPIHDQITIKRKRARRINRLPPVILPRQWSGWSLKRSRDALCELQSRTYDHKQDWL